MFERYIENRLRTKVKCLGGLAIKINCPWFVGMPDRLILGNGKVWFVELKAPGKKPSKMQLMCHKYLLKLGFKVWVIDSPEQLKIFIHDFTKAMETEQPL